MKKRAMVWAAVMGIAAAYGSAASDAAAQNFIDNEKQFHLGILPTEQSHPKTRGLSGVLATNTARGVEMLLSVDDDIPPVAARAFAGEAFAKMRGAMARAKASGKRVVFSGCGATGRLAILMDAAVKRHARETGDAALARATSHIMTGGDYALVKSVEMFEDFISFGEEQARERNLGPGDVLVAISEGGETSSVIGTLLQGVRAGAECFFVFNNPHALLAERLERCRRVIRDPRVTILDICTGPMAVAGSTRMQATTSELLVVAAAVEEAFFGRAPAASLAAFERMLRELRAPANLAALAAFVDLEAALYAAKGRMTYFSDDWLLDIFTDTTERSPTFKLPPFRPAGNTSAPVPWTAVQSLTRANRDTWLRVYEQEPMCLAWTGDDYVRLGASASIRANPPKITAEDLMAFPVGNEPDPFRTEVTPNAAAALLVGDETLDAAAWARAAAPFETARVLRIGGRRAAGDDLAVELALERTPMRLFEHLAVKLVLNNVSSAAMGKLGRLTGNWMSFVDASNKKLIDRSVRLIVEIVGVDYATACRALFATFEEMKGWDEKRLKTVSPVAHTIEKFGTRTAAADDAAPGLSWRLGVGSGAGQLRWVDETAMGSSVTQRAADRVTAEWKGHSELGADFTVRAGWTRGADGVWRADFGWTGYAGTNFVEEVRFPSLRVAADCAAGLEWVFGGDDIGRRGTLEKGAAREFRVAGGVPLIELMPAGGGAWHCDFRDTTHHVYKRFAVRNEGGAFRLECVHGMGMGERPWRDFALGYGVGFKRTGAGWFAGTQLYRAWSKRQVWSRAKADDKLGHIGMWVWNRGLITNAVPPVFELQKACGGVPVALDWYWWHANPYDTDYPDFWPPREGEAAFRAAAARLKAAGIYAQVYVNGVTWDRDGASWGPAAEAGALRRRDGEIQSVAFNVYNRHRLAWMCGENTAFFARLGGVIGHLAASGLAGVYTDMVGNSTSGACFNRAHRHPRGSGSYGINGYRAFIQGLQRKHPGLAFTTEQATEDYMDVYDGGITCNSMSCERFGVRTDPFPVFQAVHHGRGYALFGNYAHPDGTMPWDPKWPAADRWQTEEPWHEIYPVQFYYELARTTVWGCQPMVCNIGMNLFTDPAYAEELRFTVETARFYDAHKAWLHTGDMTSPEGFACDRVEVAFFQRMIFTKRDKAGTLKKTLPAVIHSCWRAADGAEALFLANPTREPRTWRFRGREGTLAPHAYAKVPLN